MFVLVVFKQKAAYDMRISDWSSDVCSSDLRLHELQSRQGEIRERQDEGQTLLRAEQGENAPVDAQKFHARGSAFDRLWVRTKEGPLCRACRRMRAGPTRADESRVGKGCVSPCRFRRSPLH